MTTNTYGSPIEVWLSTGGMAISCTIVRRDESTASVDVDSFSMRGAQREITGYLISEGYKPTGRWTTEQLGSGTDAAETWRRFKLDGLPDDDGDDA